MAVKISGVQKHSLAGKKGIKSGCVLERINDHEINDVLDYQFYIKESKLKIDFVTESGKSKHTVIKKDENDDIGLEFETYLMDKQMRCRNGCIFCFIDQMPKNMRETLYFKDDDSRLSFLFGNYITLTNLSEHDVERIIEMHISPVNVSVHTMNPELRVKMMKNKNAGRCLALLERFAKAGIKMNAQLVLCPGINDGEELEYSLVELGKLFPALQSIAVVPVGVTKFREGLFKIEEYNAQSAAQVISAVTDFGNKFLKEHSVRLAYCADEFYIKAGLEIPQSAYYEDYPQIENGVGLCRSLENEFFDALDEFDEKFTSQRVVSIATGAAAFPMMKRLCAAAENKIDNLKINVYEILNDFFGRSITVAGLITGRDLIAQLKGKELGQKLIIPSVMLRSEQDIFLDDVSLEDVKRQLNVEVETAENDGYILLERLTR